jgi:hypothetical protein
VALYLDHRFGASRSEALWDVIDRCGLGPRDRALALVVTSCPPQPEQLPGPQSPNQQGWVTVGTPSEEVMAKPLVFVGIDVAQATLEVAVRRPARRGN